MSDDPETPIGQAEQGEDREKKAYEFVFGYQEVLLERGNEKEIREYEQNARLSAQQQAAADNERLMTGELPDGFVRLERAVRLCTNLREHDPIWNYHPSFRLLFQALLARNDWSVDCLSLPDRHSDTGEAIYVNLREFRAWTLQSPLGADIADQNANEPDALNNLPESVKSDRALARHVREQRRDFASRNETHGERETVKEGWRSKAEEIRSKWPGKTQPSKRELARRIKNQLGLSDSEETIRKAL